MDLLISVAGKIAEYTVAPIGRQVGYLIFYKSNFKELTDHVKELEDARDEIKHRVEAERRNGKEIENGVQNWLDRVDGVVEAANQLQEDPRRAKVGCSRWSFPNLMLRHQLSRKATKMSKYVVEEQGKGKFEEVGYLPALDGVGSTSATRGSEKLETRKSITKDIVQALRDPKLSKIGVYGLGGVGKTTLVKEVAQKAKDDNLFEAVVKADVSKTADIKIIQGEIADLLGLRFDEETVAGRASRLRQRIKMEKTILIILDDLWTRLDLEKVGIPSGGEHNGCKVLMTSRSQDVLREMEAQTDFRLEVLTEEETWSLFKVMAGDVDLEPSLNQIASEVAKKCAGLPVLIVTVARSLANQDIHAWKDALNQLARVDSQELQEITYSALELSYHRLKDSEMKALFMHCAAVGKDPSISDLLKYGMGLGIFNNTNTVEDARNRLHKMIRALKASCLLLEDDTRERVKMHDTVREVAISIASRDQHVLIKKGAELKEWPTKEFLERCPQIFLQRCDIPELPKRLDCPSLELFWLNSANRYLKIPDSVFEGMANLKVLDITRISLSSLPTSFRSLTKLKTLCLDQCVLENIDAIGALKNLEILSLLKSSMIKLSSEVRKLTNLRMLDLSSSGIEVVPSTIISSLIKLEELYMGNTSIRWEVVNSANQNENASLAELRQLSNLTALELQIREAWMLPRDLMFEKLERYKIVIGDVWEWSDIKAGTLKTLKLKLGTNIHLEHGIKALIRRAEILYLDEIDGICNVLYQLNGEGFPLLKCLHLQNNAKIKHIVDSMERNHAQVSFPNLETLVLQTLDNLEKICHGPLAVNSFRQLRVIKTENCIQLKYLLSSSMVKGLSQLSEVEVCQCNSMKKVVLADIDASADNDLPVDKIEFFQLRSLTLKDLQTLDNFFSSELTSSMAEQKYRRLATYIPVSLFSAEVALPNLETLKLSSLNLNKIWDDNKHFVLKLANLIVENCGGIKYLFSSTMVGNFLNLKYLEISDCHMMEEIISIEEGNNGVASKEIQFSKLETIILKDMKNLKAIWYRQFSTLKTLEVENCEKIVVVFPSSMQRTYYNLERLVVTNCASVEKIFVLTSNEMSSKEGTTQLKEITLDGLPRLKQTWSREPQGILSFHNLEDVCLQNCEELEYLFPFSIATSCSHLKKLIIKWCGAMKEIVGKKGGSTCTIATFDFNELNYLFLWDLHKLEGFYSGNHTLACSSLRTIDVVNCAKLNLFKTPPTSNHGRTSDGKLHVSKQQALFIGEEVIRNLEGLRINHKEASMILHTQNSSVFFTKLTFLGIDNSEESATFPDWFLQNVHSLKDLVVEWSSYEEIFQEKRLVNEDNRTQLKTVSLYQLPKLQHICKEGSQIDPVLEVLEVLYVDECSSLINLVPSSVTFSHLTYLVIANCNGMVNLIASPTARNLAKLTTMKVTKCNSIEEIMADKGDETVYDIAFTSLEILILESLPRLKRFCSSKCFLRFPLLLEVVVRECPRMKIFSEGNTSTPNLRKVKIAENDKEWQWKDNLNDTIKNMFEDKVAFYSFKHLELSKYPELKELWYGQLQHNVFSSLKYLVVYGCDFLSNVLFQPNLLEVLMNLEELDVRDCDSLEAVFDVKGESTKEMLAKKFTQVKKLTLSGLPKLKHVWKEDPLGTLSFQNLCEVFVEECKSLKNLFPLSIARDIIQLQDLRVNSCGIEEIVAKQEGTMEIIKFAFPHLTSLDLRSLHKLKAFFPGIHILQCKSLKSINVFNCQKLELFKTQLVHGQERDENGKLYVSMNQPLFIVEEVLANLESLTLNNKDVDMILQSQYSGDQFSKLEYITVSQFDNEEAIFPYWFLENVSCLEWLVVEWSSFKEIFQEERLAGEERQIKISTRLKKLTLNQLPELKHICKEGSQIDSVLEVLEYLDVDGCSSLTNLVPSSVTFSHMTYLEVANCNGLINLIKISTAKSLVKLLTMKIKMCNLLEDVVTEKEDETNNEIAFCSLQNLELVSLPRLRRFCSCKCFVKFPLLEEVVVKECPQMEMFSLGDTSIPNLEKVQIEENNTEYCWEGDLNGTIKKMFVDMVAFSRFKHLTLSEYPELRDLWYGQLHHNMFCNLKSLVVHKSGFLSDVLFSSNVLQVLHGLEELEVRDCDSLEIVFDVKCMEAKEMLGKQTSQLKRLTLSGLPKLKHIWNNDPHEIISFGNLCTVDVIECQNLANVFPFTLCQDLKYLEQLNIESCGVGEIVAMDEGSAESSFNFPQLTKLRLKLLKNLKSFYIGRYTLECPSLKILNVSRCEALQMFAFDHSNLQQTHQVDEIHDMSIRQGLFSLDMVSPNLEELALNGKDAMRILNGHCQENLFHKVELLRLQCFDETPTNFLNAFLEIFPNLITLQVRNSSFETLFPTEGIGHCNTRTLNQMRNLWLFGMEQLRHIWHEDSPIGQLAVQNLEDLSVINCPSLISLVPSSILFKSLNEVCIDNCKGLIYLITSSTAKSLMRLTTLQIKNCEMMKAVVKIDEEEAEEQIIFENLEYLEFSSLSSLRSFCYRKPALIFPSLVRFIVEGCPQMKIFSSGVIIAPFITAIEMGNGKKRWKDDLNTTIEQLFIDKES